MTSGNIILIVDDAEVNREILAEVFGDEYIILQAENGVQAMKIIRGHRKDLAVVLLDIVMPRMNGFEVLSEMKNQNLIFDIPVIVVTGMLEASERESLIKKGASDVLFKPIEPRKVVDSVNKAIENRNFRKKLENSVKIADVSAVIKYQDMMDAVMSIMKHPNMEKPKHMLRVSAYSRIVLQGLKKDRKYKLTDEQIDFMTEGALLHDVGKLVLSTQILNKKGTMTEEEMSVMKTHCIEGCNIISIFDQSDNNEFIKYTYNICKFHHEHWNGTGYPNGIKEDAIPICAQVVGMVSEFDYITSGGTELQPRNIEYIKRSAGSKFSEKIVKSFDANIEEIKATKERINAMEESDAYDLVTKRLVDIFDIKDYDSSKVLAENYNSMLALLDATVFEIDTVTGKYRRTYTTFSDFTTIPSSGDFRADFIDLVQSDIKDEYRDEVLACLYKASAGDLNSSVVPVSSTCQIYNTFQGAYQWYRISTINMNWDPNSKNKVLLIVKNVDREIYVQSEMRRISDKAKRIARDIRKYKSENEELKAKVQYDQLTGLYNKATTIELIEEIVEDYPDSIHGMMMIDFDNFKGINDKYGHLAGDEALKEFGKVVKKQFRSCDIVGRVGGDEFAVFMTDIPDIDILAYKAENILATVRMLGKTSGMYSQITASVGIAYFPEHGSSYEVLFQKADAALYASKSHGKNQLTVFNDNTEIVKPLKKVKKALRKSKLNQDITSSIYEARYSDDSDVVGISEMMDVIGRQWKLNDCYIVDYDSSDIVFKWTAGSIIDNNSIVDEPLRDFLDLIRMQGEYREWICDDVNKLKKEVQVLLSNNMVGSFVCEPVFRNDDPIGMLLFIKEQVSTSWGEEMLDSFRLAARLCKESMIKNKAERYNRFYNKVAGILLENSGKKTHIIDESYKLLVKDSNSGIGIEWGEKCYKLLKGENSPCKDCLIKHAGKSNSVIEDANCIAKMVPVDKYNRVYVIIEKE